MSMLDELNREIAEYNNLHRGDYGIFLTKEQKEVILNFIKSKIWVEKEECHQEQKYLNTGKIN